YLGSPWLSAAYGADGLRTSRSASWSSPTFFVYDGDDPILEMDLSGTITAANVFGANGLASRWTQGSSGSNLYAFDPQGNVLKRMGAETTSDLISAWGVLAYQTGSLTDPWGYGGQWGYHTDRQSNG